MIAEFESSFDEVTMSDYIWPRYLPAALVDEYRRFFQAERDQELGRWRDPENPDFVCYPNEWDDPDIVIVLDEKLGWAWKYSRSSKEGETSVMRPIQQSARRYFEAHPEKQPWHDAQPGEVWMVRTGDEGMPYAPEIVQELFVSNQMHFVRGYERATPVDSQNIQDAYRIWPQGDDE